MSQAYQCWMCYRKYPADELGRVRVPFDRSRRGKVVVRVVCVHCYGNMLALWAQMFPGCEPVLHGF